MKSCRPYCPLSGRAAAEPQSKRRGCVRRTCLAYTAQFQSWNLITMKSAPSTGIACHKIRSDPLPRSSAQFFCSIIGTSLFVAAAVAEAPDAPTNMLGFSAANAVKKDALPPYLVYGADGDVTGDLVYVNQGMPDDYKELERHGVSVKDKIVIARYGGGWRGLKPKLARQYGAIACLIYSDPRDDGYAV